MSENTPHDNGVAWAQSEDVIENDAREADVLAPDAMEVADVNCDVPNADVRWDEFDSRAYFEHNYAKLGADDKALLEKIGEFFAACFPAAEHGQRRNRSGAGHRQGVDVGSGTNLYPAMAMLPFAEKITLAERADSNRQWLQHQLTGDNLYQSWGAFWATLRPLDQRYEKIKDFRHVLKDRTEVTQGNVFTLRERQIRYDLGTMFFVAESITTRSDEFERAVHNFIRALKPGAPFAAAFMRKSEGYPVGRRRYPAVEIDEEDVRTSLRAVACVADIDIINNEPVRPGYDGMILATGRAGARR